MRGVKEQKDRHAERIAALEKKIRETVGTVKADEAAGTADTSDADAIAATRGETEETTQNADSPSEDYAESRMRMRTQGAVRNKVLLIYNPRSGSGMFKNNLDLIVRKFQSRGMIGVPVRADASLSVDQFLAEIDVTYYRKIIAAGGDGTINIVVNAMIRNDIHLPLALFPAGTANDFAHYFDIPTDIDGMLSIALGDNYTEADVGRCNDKYFVNVAAIGSVIDVSQKTDATMKNALGIVAYYLRGLSEMTSLKPVEVTITSPEYNFTENIFFMVVMNGNSAGGFRKLGVQSSINDGLLDVIIFKDMYLIEILPLVINVMQGKHDENKNVIYFQTPSLRIESPVNISTDVDGENGEPLPLQIDIIPRRLRINTRRQDEAPDTPGAHRQMSAAKGETEAWSDPKNAQEQNILKKPGSGKREE